MSFYMYDCLCKESFCMYKESSCLIVCTGRFCMISYTKISCTYDCPFTDSSCMYDCLYKESTFMDDYLFKEISFMYDCLFKESFYTKRFGLILCKTSFCMKFQRGLFRTQRVIFQSCHFKRCCTYRSWNIIRRDCVIKTLKWDYWSVEHVIVRFLGGLCDGASGVDDAAVPDRRFERLLLVALRERSGEVAFLFCFGCCPGQDYNMCMAGS